MNLSQYRKSLGLTQKEMSEALGIHQASLARSERAWPNVSMRFLLELSRVYNVRLMIYPEGRAEFMTLDEIKKSDSQATQDDFIGDLDYLKDVGQWQQKE